jgi:signal peptide peptidase SppA
VKSYARIAARLFNTPLLVTPEAALAVADVIAARMAGEPVARAFFGDDDDARERPPYDVAQGVAVIPVQGELVNRGSWLNSLSGLTSYEALAQAITQAVADPSVVAILLDVDSPGGEAAGAMETAAKIRAANAQKPVTAYVNSLAASAAYALAAGAGEIVTPPSGLVGSIGVVMLHLDRSAKLAKDGLKPTLIHAGAYKVDGNSLGPLPDDARARIQAQIDGVYDLFTASVGAHRPKLGVDGARQTEAGVFMGERAVEAGLADRLGDLDSALASARSRAARAGFFSGASMTSPVNEPVATARPDPVESPAAVEAAMADEMALNSARKEGATAALARAKAILNADVAKGREKLAAHFAFDTEMSAEQALAALALSPAEKGARLDGLKPPALNAAPTQHSDNDQASADRAWSEIAANLNARR